MRICKIVLTVQVKSYCIFYQIGKPHPDPVVETASMASVEPPDVWYDLHLPDSTINEGKLSALQVKTTSKFE